jgi:xylulokinase
MFFGLSMRHAKPHLTRAVIEGISFALRDNLEIIKHKGVVPREIRVTGGGGRSPFWLQTLADIFGLPVRAIDNPEGAALGAAILAGVGTAVYRDFAEASKLVIRAQAPVKPIAKNVKAYHSCYERFRALYPATKDLLIQH